MWPDESLLGSLTAVIDTGFPFAQVLIAPKISLHGS